MTSSPGPFSTGMDSPVSMDSSTAERPSSDDAVHGDLLAGPHHDHVADDHVLHGDVDLDGGAAGAGSGRRPARRPSRRRRPPGRRPPRRASGRRAGAQPAAARRAAVAGAGRTTRAVLACRPMSLRMAADVCPLARASS